MILTITLSLVYKIDQIHQSSLWKDVCGYYDVSNTNQWILIATIKFSLIVDFQTTAAECQSNPLRQTTVSSLTQTCDEISRTIALRIA